MNSYSERILRKHTAIGMYLLVALPAFVLGGFTSPDSPQKTIAFSELLTFKREISLITPDSSLEASSGLKVLPFSRGFLASNGKDRLIRWFEQDGRFRETFLLDILDGPECLKWLKLSVSDGGKSVAVYDALTNSLRTIDLESKTSTTVTLSVWRADQLGSRRHDFIAVGPKFSEEPHILVRSYSKSGLTDICEITSDLAYPRLYQNYGFFHRVIVTDDGGFYFFESTSMRILAYSNAGKLLNGSTERPMSFIPPPRDSVEYSSPERKEFVKPSALAISFVRVGDCFLVSWVNLAQGKVYMEVFDLNFRLRVSQVELPNDLIPEMSVSRNSIFFLRSNGFCSLPGRNNREAKRSGFQHPILVEYQLNANVFGQ